MRDSPYRQHVQRIKDSDYEGPTRAIVAATFVLLANSGQHGAATPAGSSAVIEKVRVWIARRHAPLSMSKRGLLGRSRGKHRGKSRRYDSLVKQGPARASKQVSAIGRSVIRL